MEQVESGPRETSADEDNGARCPARGALGSGKVLDDVTERSRQAVTSAPRVVTSKTNGRVSEVTHVTRVKSGWVPIGPQLSYAGRLRLLLNTLGRVRRYDHFRSPLDRLRSLHFIRWVLIDDDTRLLFTSEFDHSWDRYVRLFVDNAPNLIDLIWTHTEGYEWGVAADHDRFSQWVRDHQIETQALFAANPGATVRDIQQYEVLKRDVDEFLLTIGLDDHLGDDARALADLRGKVRQFQEKRLLLGARVKDQVFPRGDDWPAEAEREYSHIEQAFGSLRAYFAPHEMNRFNAAFAEFLSPRWFEHKAKRRAGGVGHGGSAISAKKLPDTLAGLAANPPPPALAREKLAQIQAHILHDYAELDHAQLLFFRIDDAEGATDWLGELSAQVATADAPTGAGAVNVCLSHAGLQTLGFPRQVLLAFPDEFRLGMARRFAALDDGGNNLSEHWLPPHCEGSTSERIALEAVDLVVFVHAARAGDLEGMVGALVARAREQGVALLGRETAQRRRNAAGEEIEPFFGHRDGISQPCIEGLHAAPGPGEPAAVKLGELVLGHPANRLPRSRLPKLDALGMDELYLDGSFVAIRKLAKLPSVDVWKDRPEIDLFMGRRRDGAPLLPSADGRNAFDYEQDASGAGCPFSAHARRANPRFPRPNPEGDVPRIARRAIAYRQDQAAGSVEEGMFFIAFNASLAQQYEVLQSWINNANVGGGFSDEADPIAATNGHDNLFTYRDHEGGIATLRVPAFTKVQWGLYLFAPSRRALESLRRQRASALRLSPARVDPLPPGEPDADQARLERHLAEQPTAATEGARVWRTVDQAGGIADSAAGVLVSHPTLIRRLLEQDGDSLSVVEYGRRMGLALGARAPLGQDYGDDRPAGARRALEFFARRDTITLARRCSEARTRAHLEQLLLEAERTGEAPMVSLPPLLQAVLPWVVDEIFGTGWGEAEARQLVPLALDVAGYLFNPHLDVMSCPAPVGGAPTVTSDPQSSAQRLELGARSSGERLTRLFAARPAASGATFRGALGDLASDALITSFAIGTTAPTTGTFSNVMRHWVAEGGFARVRSKVVRWEAGTPEVVEAELTQELLRAMQRNPQPGVLYRQCRKPIDVAGFHIAEGRFVILRLSADSDVAARGGWGLVFGHGVHQCPGARVGLEILLGILAPLLLLPNARPLPGRLALTFDRAGARARLMQDQGHGLGG